MAKTKDVIVVEGSRTDDAKTNLVLEILHAVGVTYRVFAGSCHWHSAKDFESFVDDIRERFIVFIGGMELAAPGIIAARNRNNKTLHKLVIGIPTDKAARSAIENLPFGTAVLTPGLNETSVKHSIQNGALSVAQLVGMNFKPKVLEKLNQWYAEMRDSKPLEEIELNEKRLIPIEEKKGG